MIAIEVGEVICTGVAVLPPSHRAITSANAAAQAMPRRDKGISGLSGARRIAQGRNPSQRVTAIDPVVHQESFDEGTHLVLRERKGGVTQMKRGAFQ